MVQHDPVPARQQELEDRVQFARMLETELRTLVQQLPQRPSTTIDGHRRNVLKEFETVATYLEIAVHDITKHGLQRRVSARLSTDEIIRCFVTSSTIASRDIEKKGVRSTTLADSVEARVKEVAAKSTNVGADA